MPSVKKQQIVLKSAHKIKWVVHDPIKVPDPKKSAFFPNRKQGQRSPIKPVLKILQLALTHGCQPTSSVSFDKEYINQLRLCEFDKE